MAHCTTLLGNIEILHVAGFEQLWLLERQATQIGFVAASTAFEYSRRERERGVTRIPHILIV